MGKRTDPSNARLPHIIVQGNPVDGFAFTGPFPNVLSAVEHADEQRLGQWWVAPLYPPEQRCVECGEPWPCSDSKRRDLRADIRAKHHT